MKKIIVLLLCFSFSSCILALFDWGGEEHYEYASAYEAVSLNRTELDAAIKFEDNVIMTSASKIYIFDKYIFINDKRRGFHIYDNSDPENPVKKTFLHVPGATDVAIRDDVFFINQATDLISITPDLETLSLSVNKRIENVFPEIISPDGYSEYVGSNKVVVYWKEK